MALPENSPKKKNKIKSVLILFNDRLIMIGVALLTAISVRMSLV